MSTSNLPPLKETNKFSSWTDKNLFDQVDELLFEQENQTQGSKNGKTSLNNQKDSISSSSAKNQLFMNTSDNKESILSLSGSLLDLDSYEIEDEVNKLSDRSGSNKQAENHNDQNYTDNSGESGDGNDQGIADSLDLDNSDDLNKIIQRYETMLSSNPTTKDEKSTLNKSQSSQLSSSLEESWGSNQFNNTNGSEDLKKAKKTEDEYEQDDFEQQDDEYGDDEDKLVDEEIYLNSSIGKKDSEFLRELLQQPIRTKQNQALDQSKSQVKTGNTSSESSGEYSDDIDEFIKKHIESEELSEKKTAETQKTLPKKDLSTSSSSSSDEEEPKEEEKRSPKQVLLDELKKLSDIFGKYSLTDREMFLSDFENILKILTYEEVKQYILPCLDIYANEQEFLKLQFFQKIPHLFKKLFRNQIFPLICKMLNNSEEQVQAEGVEALLQVSKDTLKLEDAQLLVSSLVQLIMAKADQSEAAKIAVLMIVEKFSEAKIFLAKECILFINEFLAVIQKGMLFKIKKFLLPTLMAISVHIPYDMFEKHVYSTFIKFTQDEIWGVRKVCLEKLQDFVKLIRPDEFTKLSHCVQFLQSSLNDPSRWVKNQAFSQFGHIIYEIYLKGNQMSNQSDKAQLKFQISESFNIFYDVKFIQANDEDQFICQSFMGNQNDDTDKVKYSWAFYIGCALQINGGQEYWEAKIKAVYQKLFKDILLNVRKSLASSLTEIMKLVDLQNQENQSFFLEVVTHYMSDIDDIKLKVMPNLCQFIACYPKEQHNQLLSTLIRQHLESDQSKKRDSKICLLEQIYSLFSPQFLAEQEFHLQLTNIIEKEQFIQYKKRACKLFGQKVVAPLIKSKKYRKNLTTFVDNLRLSKNFRERQMYLMIAKATFKADNEIFKKHFAKAIGQDLINERIKVVQIVLAKICLKVPEGYSKSIDKVRTHIKSSVSCDDDLMQYLSKEEYRKRSELKSEEEAEQPQQSSQSPEDEEKEREAFEKTVQIRFANYSTLAKTQSSTGLGEFNSLFSSSLMALLGGFLNTSTLGKDSSEAIQDKSEEALLGKTANAANSSWQQ